MHSSARGGVARLVSLSVMGLTIPFVATALGGPAGAAGVTAASAIKATKAAIGKQASARVEFDASSTSGASEKIVGNLTTSEGSETVTDGEAVLVVRVTSADAYASGTSSGLTSLFGMTAAAAKKLGTRWEYWKTGTTQYSGLKEDVTVRSLENLLPKAKGTTVSSDGSGVVLKWTSAATSTAPTLSNTLEVSSAKLPTVETSTDAAGEKATTTVSKWGEKVVVHAPPAASTIAASRIKS